MLQTKQNIGDDDYMNQLQTIYQKAGYKVMFASATEEQGVDEIKKMLKGKKYRVLPGPQELENHQCLMH